MAKGDKDFSTKFKGVFVEHGIKRELSNSRIPHGVEKRKRTHCEGAKEMRLHAIVPKYLWGEALVCANFLCNRWPSEGLDGKTPF